jgi:hypothetical protein
MVWVHAGRAKRVPVPQAGAGAAARCRRRLGWRQRGGGDAGAGLAHRAMRRAARSDADDGVQAKLLGLLSEATSAGSVRVNTDCTRMYPDRLFFLRLCFSY